MYETAPALLHAAVLLTLAFATLAALDGVYIHLVQLKLHQRRESWSEHVLHTLRALLFVPGVYAIFAVVSGGRLLWFGLCLFAVDQVIEIFDQVTEKDSRAQLGGLGSPEYVVHGVLTALRSAAVALSLAGRPAAAFSWHAPNTIGTLAEPYGSLIRPLFPGAVLLLLVHVWLAWRHCPRRAAHR